MVKIDVVIPTYIGDFDCIQKCVENLLLQTVLPNHIIIAVSEINKIIRTKLEIDLSKLDKKNTNIIILDTIEKRYCAQNRNRGIVYAKEHTIQDIFLISERRSFILIFIISSSNSCKILSIDE